ncbi:MAG: Rpn family recombination-promoting nuclease/putative transposase [Bacteroidetes bacterium]|nr:Rpn family recombination-promoting nuclease/putative transposase [Bacteroidota bacterium]
MTFKEKYINPFTDFGFKKLFGTEPNKDLLINFLNEVILPQQKKVADLSYRRNEHIGHTEMDRKAIFDLYCVSPSGERFIVEMQKAKQNYFKDRSVFYSTFPIQEQAQAGDWNYRLSAVYTVGILDFTFNDDDSKGNSTKEVRHEVQLKNQKGDVFYDKLTFVYLEMPHFNKSEDELETTYDKWLFVLKHLPNLTERPQKLQDRIFQRLFEAAEIAKFSHEEKEQYEESLKSYRDLKNVIDTAFDEGEAKGKEERATEIASNMLKKGLPIDLVGEITELPLELIAKLKENLL